MDGNDISKFLPLTESTCYIMLALTKPLHGYGVMQCVDELSDRAVRVGPGTLYGAVQALERAGLIVRSGVQNRRKSYVLTPGGREVLAAHISRLETMIAAGRTALGPRPDNPAADTEEK